jgi:hypothetical protein
MQAVAFAKRRVTSISCALVTCVLLAATLQAPAAGADAVFLPAMDGAAPHAIVIAVDRAPVTPSATGDTAGASLASAPNKGAVLATDKPETPFPLGWMFGLLAVLVVVAFDRVRLSMKLAKLNEDALRASGLRAPYARD